MFQFHEAHCHILVILTFSLSSCIYIGTHLLSPHAYSHSVPVCNVTLVPVGHTLRPGLVYLTRVYMSKRPPILLLLCGRSSSSLTCQISRPAVLCVWFQSYIRRSSVSFPGTRAAKEAGEAVFLAVLAACLASAFSIPTQFQYNTFNH